jgi:transcriptional regulator with GAF, ATPase, and Fis domain
MSPRFVSISGPLEGTAFNLSEATVTVGRDRGSRLWIDDPSVSRQHSLIKGGEGRFTLSDLGSYNGTRVNGIPIKERVLEHGDMVSIGDSLFLFLLHDEAPPTIRENEVQLDDSEADEPTILLRIEDALYLHPEKLLAALPATARLARDLNALIRISAGFSSITRIESLQTQLLESVFEVLPAQRAAILFKDPASQEFQSVLGRHRSAQRTEPVQVSRTIVIRVMTERIAVLSKNVLASRDFADVDSLRGGHARSLLCVPLAVFDKTLGAIYLDTADAEVQFDENHLQLLTAIAAVASISIENVRRLEWLEGENERLRAAVASDHSMVGESASMRALYSLISRVAPSDTTVLILGESGTGKEMAAQAIHANSTRRERSFIAINCAVLSDALLESELFGHEKGAFTGAIAQKKGKIEIADGGTLFLDEVGELALGLQAKLLRVLQEREFERLGGTRPIKINVRLIAATNTDLDQAIRGGSFRQDLYYRLNVVQLTMPPLRDRKEDIDLLASYFAVRYGEDCNRRIKGISAEARACLLSYDWPGNVRELENAIERAAVLGATEIILPDDLPEAVLEAVPPSSAPASSYHDAVKVAKRELILRALEQTSGNYVDAARVLRIHPNNLHRLIRNLDLKPSLKK